MEKKKQILVKVLNKLVPYRDLASGLLVLVESNYVDEKTLDGLIDIMSKSMENVKKEINKSVLDKGMLLIKQIREKEMNEKEEADLDKMLEEI